MPRDGPLDDSRSYPLAGPPRAQNVRTPDDKDEHGTSAARKLRAGPLGAALVGSGLPLSPLASTAPTGGVGLTTPTSRRMAI